MLLDVNLYIPIIRSFLNFIHADFKYLLMSSIFMMYCSIEIVQDWSTFVEELDCVLDVGVFPEPDSDLCFALRADLFQPAASPNFFTIPVISLMLAGI